MIAALLITSQRGVAKDDITACAIRWDAWYSNGPTDPARYTAAALRPRRFHKLAPLHAKFDSDGNIRWLPSQETFDAEIRSAHKAGLCWAYLMYGSGNVIDLNNAMMKGLAFHRASKLKSLVSYSLILTESLLGTPTSLGESTTAIVDLISDSNYQSISVRDEKRPLLFLYYETSPLAPLLARTLEFTKHSMEELRALAVKRGLGNPYIVLLLSPAESAERLRVALNADAISEYISGERQTGPQTWLSFEPTIERDWNNYSAATTATIVPTVRSGADIRARCQSPPPFEHRFPAGSNCNDFYVANPSLVELKEEFQDATTWIRKNPDRDPGRILLIYAWSECDESGNCLMPTYGDPNGNKLDAVAIAIK